MHRGPTHHVYDRLGSTKQGIIITSKYSIDPNAFRNLPLTDDRCTLDLYLDAIIDRQIPRSHAITRVWRILDLVYHMKQSMTSNDDDGLKEALDVATVEVVV